MPSFPDDVCWDALTGRQADIAIGDTRARRFATGYTPLVAFANATQPDFDALAAICAPGEALYCMFWDGAEPAGWRIDAELMLCQMVWRAKGSEPAGSAQRPTPRIVTLGPRHVPAVMALTDLTRPGPFGPKTLLMGEYVGVFEEGESEAKRLIAMAGERLHAGNFREVSGVCTHPDHRGAGLARRLMMHIIDRQLQRGQTPFLHVVRDNVGARELYERMGFAAHRDVLARVVTRR